MPNLSVAVMLPADDGDGSGVPMPAEEFERSIDTDDRDRSGAN
jgi:hypothetical protein